MAGRNLYSPVAAKSFQERSQGRPCVFISHRQADKDAAKAMASFLQQMDIDIYLDEYDQHLLAATAVGDAEKVVAYIEGGISLSTHLLGIISPNTKGSWWVPFEIGSARRKQLSLAYVLLDSVDFLPEYLQITKHILDQYDLRKWVKEEIGRETRLAAKSIDEARVNIPRLPGFRSGQLHYVNAN